MDSKKSKKNIELIERLINHNLKIIIFFQSDLTKYKILLMVMISHYQKEDQTIEKIIEDLPKNISSRAHQLNCITDGAAKGYLLKEISKADMRKKYLRPSEELVIEFEEYINIFFDK